MPDQSYESAGCQQYIILFSSFFCLVVVEIIARCGAHSTTTTTAKHVWLICFGVDPCGTAKNTVEGCGSVEHCKESENDYKKGVRRTCIDVFEHWERKTQNVLFWKLTGFHVSDSTDIPVGDIRIECTCSIKSYTRKQPHEKQRRRKRTRQEEKEWVRKEHWWKFDKGNPQCGWCTHFLS